MPVARFGTLTEFLFILVLLVPAFYVYRGLMRWIRPRESAPRFFLFILANFLLVVVYTMTMVAVIVRLFPIKR